MPYGMDERNMIDKKFFLIIPIFLIIFATSTFATLENSGINLQQVSTSGGSYSGAFGISVIINTTWRPYKVFTMSGVQTVLGDTHIQILDSGYRVVMNATLTSTEEVSNADFNGSGTYLPAGTYYIGSFKVAGRQNRFNSGVSYPYQTAHMNVNQGFNTANGVPSNVTTLVSDIKNITIEFQDAIVQNANLILKNYNGQILQSTTIEESESFFINSNYTINNIENKDAICNFSSNNISSHYSITGSNLTLTPTVNVTLQISEFSTHIKSDSFNFKICKIGATPISLDVIINNSVFLNIPNSNIIGCSIGFFEINNLSTRFNSTQNINLTLACNGCGVNNIRLISGNLSELLRFDRNMNFHNENLTYNTTTKLYEYKNYQYSFFKSGINRGQINITCNSTIYPNIFNVSNSNLTIVIRTIDNIPYSNGMIVESTESTNISIVVRGDFINFQQMNITNSTGTLIKTTSESFITLNLSDLPKNGIYNISIAALDDDNSWTSLVGFFQINDSITPSIIWNNPTFNNESESIVNQTFQTMITVSDNNLFAYVLRIKNPNGIEIYNFNMTDLNVTSQNINNLLTLDILGNYIFNLTVSDDHTAKEISNYVIEKESGNKLNFIFDNKVDRQIVENNISIEYKNDDDAKSFSAIKNKDRYNFILDANIGDDKLSSVKRTFILKCDNIIFRSNSNHIAHFVCPRTKNWIDFDNENIIDWNVKKLRNDEYEINLFVKPIKIIEFSSIGGINEIEQDTILSVIPEPTGLTLLSFSLNNYNNIFFLFILIILWLGLNIISFTFKNIAFGGMAFFIGIIIGMMLFNFHWIMTAIFFLFNIGIFFTTAKFK